MFQRHSPRAVLSWPRVTAMLLSFAVHSAMQCCLCYPGISPSTGCINPHVASVQSSLYFRHVVSYTCRGSLACNCAHHGLFMYSVCPCREPHGSCTSDASQAAAAPQLCAVLLAVPQRAAFKQWTRCVNIRLLHPDCPSVSLTYDVACHFSAVSKFPGTSFAESM